MSYNVECKLILREFSGVSTSKIVLPINEEFEPYEPGGIDCVSRVFIYAMLGMGHSVKAIKESFDREILDSFYDQTGLESFDNDSDSD